MQLGPWPSRDEEKRKLRVKVATLERALKTQQEARRELEEKVKELEQKTKEDQKRIQELEDRCKELERQRDRFRSLIFKPNLKSKKERQKEVEEKGDISSPRKRGAQKGHRGRGRKLPGHIDEVRRVYLRPVQTAELL